jgi:hypothetical protein
MNTATTRFMALIGVLVCGIAAGSAVRLLSRHDQRSRMDVRLEHGEALSFEASTDDRRERIGPEKFFDRLHDALGQSERGRRARLIAALADELDAAQVREAVEKLVTSRIPNRKEVIAQLFSRWGVLEPLAAMEFARNLSIKSEQRDATIAALNGWMETDAGAAEEWVRDQPNNALKNAAWEAVIMAYAANSPQHALALAEQIRLLWLMTNDIAEAIFAQWVRLDPQTAAAHVAALPKGYFRSSSLSVVAAQWAETDPVRALSWAESLPDRLPDVERSFGLLPTPIGADRSNVTQRILGTWIVRDPGEAIKWISQIEDDTRRLSAVADASYFNTERGHDPAVAVQLLNLLPQGELRDRAYISIASRFCSINPTAAINLLSEEKDQGARNTIIWRLASDLKGENLLAVLNQSSVVSLEKIRRWTDPETAVAWASRQSGNEKVLPRIAGAWLAKDPERATEFINQFSSPMKDTALSSGIDATLSGGANSPQEWSERFERASRWIPEIVDPITRQEAYRNLGEWWMEIDAETARKWIDSIPISGDLKSELLKKLPKNK